MVPTINAVKYINVDDTDEETSLFVAFDITVILK